MPAPTPVRFGVVGSGWRAEFFVRMARLMPERFTCTGVVTRTAERGAQVEAAWGVPTVRTVTELVTGDLPGAGRSPDRPELVVTATPWPVTPDVVRELVDASVPVLAETPPAPDVEGLRDLWADVGSAGLVQVAEHSPFMPAHQARRALVADGVIGEPTSVQVSSTHLYHAVGLARRLLGAGRGPATVHARAFTAPLVDPVGRDARTGATAPQPARTLLATIDLGDGRHVLYDFTDNQWHNPLRANRIVVRGSHGEVVDDAVTRWVDERTWLTSPLVRRQSGIEQDLDGVRPRARVVRRARALPQPLRRCAPGRRRPRGRAPARRHGRVGPWRRTRPVPAGRRLPGPPARPGRRGVRAHRGARDDRRGGVGARLTAGRARPFEMPTAAVRAIVGS